MSIENWETDLAQLMFSFKKGPELGVAGSYQDPTVFTDQFGNILDFGNQYFDALILLRNPELKTVEVRELDRGSMSFSLYEHADSYYMLYQTSVNTRWVGHFTSFVVVPTLKPVIEFLEGLVAEAEEEGCGW